MTTTVFLAVILAALLHASWNAMVKGGADKYAAMAAVMLGHIPPALACLPFASVPDAAAWPWFAAGIFCHLGYQLFLIAGYRLGDLTQVYPIARGAAPLIVAVVSVAFLAVPLGRTELLAVAMIGVGIISISLVRHADGSRNPRAVAMALVTGCFIASYSLVDGIGARVAGTALGYWSWAAIGNALVFVVWMAFRNPAVLRRLPRDRALIGLGLAGGAASFAAYALVIWAFTQAPIALVTALRETSIVFALLIGVFVLKERLNLGKVLSTLVTISGAILLRASR